jgi:predicted nucleic acid-binding protein
LILYLDTSSLVKLYVDEAHSESVRQWVTEAELVATCRVAYPETLSALTRRCRNGDLSRQDFDLLVQCFTDEWGSYAALDFDELEAGRLVTEHGLRGFDAVHLAAAKTLRNPDYPISTTFSSFDAVLNRAAAAEGLTVMGVGE